MKYWMIILSVQNGSYEGNHYGLIQSETKPDAEEYACNFMDGGAEENEEMNGTYYFDDNCVCVQVDSCKQMSKNDYYTVSKFVTC